MNGLRDTNRRTVLKTLGMSIVGGAVVASQGAAAEDTADRLWKTELTSANSDAEGTGHFAEFNDSGKIDFIVDAHRLPSTPPNKVHVHEGEDTINLKEFGDLSTADSMFRVSGSFPVTALEDNDLSGDIADVHFNSITLTGTITKKKE